jgi:phospholipase C
VTPATPEQEIVMAVWHNSPDDEHPPANVTEGMDATWQRVDAVVQGGGWDQTAFMLTWDDWGGYDDHVKTPVLEYTPDNVQLALGPRVPLLVFGGAVKPGIDSRWCSHASIAKTAMQLLGLPALGVARVDHHGGSPT